MEIRKWHKHITVPLMLRAACIWLPDTYVRRWRFSSYSSAKLCVA